MPGIVSDTTPLNYLVLIKATDILPRLYERVVLPPAVRAELSAPEAPEPVREWISSNPAWLEVLRCSKAGDADLARLDTGEREAILLATELGASLLLMDERDGAGCRSFTRTHRHRDSLRAGRCGGPRLARFA